MSLANESSSSSILSKDGAKDGAISPKSPHRVQSSVPNQPRSSSKMSINTMNSKRSNTSRRSVKISLDNFNEDNLQPPFLTSPRSLHACKKEGVLPEELVHRPPSCYDNKDKNLPPRVVELRYQTANNARKQRLKIVMEAYKKLCEEGHHDHKYGNNGSATNRSVSSNGEEEKKLIEKVMKEMEFQKMKQKEEVETMLLLEIRAQRIQQKAAAKAAEQAERAAELAAAKALKDAEWQEHKAAMEAKKRQDEIDAAILAKKLAEERLQQDLAEKDRKEKEEKERKKAAQDKEAEHLAKQAQLKAKQESYNLELLRQAEERQQLMDDKDTQRQAAREEQRKQLEAANERKRLETEARIAAAKDAQAQAMAEQLAMFAEKERKSEEKRQQFEKVREGKMEELRVQAEEKAAHMRRVMEGLAQQEQERLAVYAQRDAEALERLRLLAEEQSREEERKRLESETKAKEQEAKRLKAKEQEELKKLSIMTAAQQHEHHMRQVEEEKHQERLYILEKARLLKEEKAATVERLQRIEAYNMELALQKMEDEKQRIAELAERKVAIQRQQLELKKKQEAQKRALTEAMDRMKKTHKWVPPEGVDIEIDIDRLVKQVDHEMGPPADTPRVATAAKAAAAKQPAAKRPQQPAGSDVEVVEETASSQASPRVKASIDKPQSNSSAKSPAPSSPRTNKQVKVHVLPEAQQETASTSTEEPRPNDTGSTEEVPPEVLDVMAAEKVQEEQRAEQERAGALKQSHNDEARMDSLGKLFAVERAKASERILRMTAEHEIILVQRMAMLKMA